MIILILELRFVSYFKAPNGANFDLLADDELRKFFIKLKQLWTAIHADNSEPLDHFKKKLGQISQAVVSHAGDKEFFEVVALADVKSFLDTYRNISQSKIFPTDIFNVVKTPFPKPATEVTNVKEVFHIGKTDKDDRIFIFNDGTRNLVCLQNINRWLSLIGAISSYLDPKSYFDSETVFAALRFDLFHDKKTGNFFIDLRDVRNFLEYVDGSEELLQRFNFQVFMSPSPAVSTFANLDCKPFLNAIFDEKPFTIFKGNGFAENAFFFKPNNLADILGLDTDDDNALDETIFAAGELWDGAERFCRLDFAPYITRHCLARLWNGSNQNHHIIKTGWQFIHWFKDFLPKFYEQYVPIRCGAQYIPDADWELGDTLTRDDSIKSFFETFDKACRNFKSQLLEAQS